MSRIEDEINDRINHIICVEVEKKCKTILEENKKLKKAIEYRKKKADKNQEKANEIDKILKIPGILKEDGKIDRPKVAFIHII